MVDHRSNRKDPTQTFVQALLGHRSSSFARAALGQDRAAATGSEG
jgi:hypothetical protein